MKTEPKNLKFSNFFRKTPNFWQAKTAAILSIKFASTVGQSTDKKLLWVIAVNKK